MEIASYAVKAGITMNKRHKAITEFQKFEDFPKLFISTVRVGSVGVNVQSATRVFMMEPCIDPGTEVQIAGRIHRLGQLKDVLVKRYFFADTVEEQTVGLHADIKAGSTSLPNGTVDSKNLERLLGPAPSRELAGPGYLYGHGGFGGGYGGFGGEYDSDGPQYDDFPYF